jgi:murein DD-endopeptidase MepM/ murein hydrolase activator NlpD
MLKAKTKMIERDSEAFASEVFAVADNITPIAIASVDGILKLEDTEDLQVVPEKKVKQLIVENKSTNPMSKFFVRLGTYLDSMENFLSEMHSNYMKGIEQKRSLHGLEDSDQKRKTARAKRTARKLAVNKFLNSFKFSGKQDLYDMPLGLMVANFLRGGFEDRIADQAESIVIVPYQPVAGQLKAKGETEDEYVSGYKLTSAYGHRWGKMHGGVDIGVPVGTMFALKKKSIVKFAGYQNPDDPSVGYGLLVDAWVPSLNKMFRFAHLSEVGVKEGDTVDAGKVLGKSGNTGISTGPHFHIEVHPEVRPDYGGENPMPYIDYVIAGDEMMEQKSEGSIERVGRVMVGEAGAEFVIPMSQMPIFAQLMMEEKIKSLNPSYRTAYGRFDNLGVERESGFTNTMMAEGGITFKENHKVAARRLTQFFPGKRYLVAGILGNLEHESPGLKPDVKQYGGGPGRGIAQWEHYPDGGGPYPDSSGTDYGRWQTALDMYGGPVFKSLPKQLDFLKWELDTQHPNADDVSKLPSGFATRKYVVDVPKNVREATYNFMYDYERPDEIAQANWETERLSKAFIFFDNMDKLLGKSKKPKTPPVINNEVQMQIEKNLRDRNTMSPEDFFGTKPVFSSSLNSIPGNEQMQIANETQEQFSFDNAKGEIVALYQPTVYYTES